MISDLSKSFLAEIKHFLEQYKALEKRKYSIVGKWHNKIEALKVIEASKQGK
jgi:inorganic pyrophosphatase